MTDIRHAREGLSGHAVCACRGDVTLCADGRGVAPLLAWLDAGQDLTGFAAADRVVGKAAAMLLVCAGVREIHGQTLSRPAADWLSARGVPFSYDTLTDRILNRRGDGPCPMEAAVAALDDPFDGLRAIRARRRQMHGQTDAPA